MSRKLKVKSLRLNLIEKFVPWFAPYRRNAWFLNVSPIIDPRFRVQVADQIEHYDQAFALFRNEFKQVADLAGISVYPTQCLLPSTSTIVALWDDRVVGSLLITRANPLGFISGSVVDQQNLYDRSGGSLVEVLGFSVAPEEETIRLQILMYLARYAYAYVLKFVGARYILTGIERKNIEFYKGVFGFENLPRNVVRPDLFSTSFFMGLVDLRKTQAIHERLGYGLVDRFFSEPPLARMFFPSGNGLMRLSPQLLQSLLGNNSQKSKCLNKQEILALKNIYSEQQYKYSIPGVLLQNEGPSPRFTTLKPVDLCHALGSLQGTTQNVSDFGLCVVFKEDNFRLRVGDVYRIELATGPKQRLSLLSRIIWSQSGKVGLRVEDVPPGWSKWLGSLSKKLSKVTV